MPISLSHAANDCQASLSHPAPPLFNALSIFHFLALGGYPVGQSSPNLVEACRRISTILQNFSQIAQTVYDMCVTKILHFFGLPGLTLWPKFTKGEMTC